MRLSSADLGTHKGARRQLVLEGGEFGAAVSGANIAAGNFVEGASIYVPGFTDFFGALDTTTPIATTLDVRVRPGFLRNSIFVNENFTIATLTTFANPLPQRYTFAWGASRGLLVGGTGSTYVYSELFRFVLVNTGAQPANATSVIRLECS